MGIEHLARPELLKRSAYVSAVPDRQLIRLHANESPWSIDSSAINIFDPRQTLDSEHAQLNRYPDPACSSLVCAMADYYQVPENYVLPVRGSDDGIDLLIRAFCIAAQDSILVNSPTFSMYASFAGLQNAQVIDIPMLDEGHFSLNKLGILDRACGSKIVFLCTPNNPTGHSIDLSTISELCTALSDQSLVCVDEAYIEFSPFVSASALLQQFENLVILRTMSKAFGAAGIRCGAVLAQPSLLAILQSIVTPYALSTLTIDCALKGFDPAVIEAMDGRILYLTAQCQSLYDALLAQPCVQRVYPSDANFLLVKFANSAGVLQKLREAGVLVRDFSDKPGTEDCLRITIGREEENAMVLRIVDQFCTAV